MCALQFSTIHFCHLLECFMFSSSTCSSRTALWPWSPGQVYPSPPLLHQSILPSLILPPHPPSLSSTPLQSSTAYAGTLKTSSGIITVSVWGKENNRRTTERRSVYSNHVFKARFPKTVISYFRCTRFQYIFKLKILSSMSLQISMILFRGMQA